MVGNYIDKELAKCDKQGKILLGKIKPLEEMLQRLENEYFLVKRRQFCLLHNKRWFEGMEQIVDKAIEEVSKKMKEEKHDN